jgi:hypothetical protein
MDKSGRDKIRSLPSFEVFGRKWEFEAYGKSRINLRINNSCTRGAPRSMKTSFQDKSGLSQIVVLGPSQILGFWTALGIVKNQLQIRQKRKILQLL